MINIRTVQLKDVNIISSVLAASWKSAYRGIVDDKYLDSLECDHWVDFLISGLNNDSIFAMVIENADQTVGAAILSKTEKEREACLISFYLLPDKIGQGLGHAFYIGIENELINMGFSSLVLDVLENNNAVTRIGAVAVMFNAFSNVQEAAYALEYADVELLLVGEGRKGTNCEGICAEVLSKTISPKLKEVFSIGNGSHYALLQSILDKSVATPSPKFKELKEAVCPEDVAAILFTSGTTSRPKGVVLTHFGLVNNSRAMADSLRATINDRYCLVLPMFHCFSLSANLLSCLHTGAALVFLSDRHSITILNAIAEHRCTLLNAVPTLLLSVISCPDFAGVDISSLRAGILGGSAISPSQYYDICEKMGFRPISSLGQTEATAGITMVDYDAPAKVNAETVGKFLLYVEGKIVDLTDGSKLSEGIEGEICIKGYNVMRGYYKPDIDGEAVGTDGWLRTGDLGFLDEKRLLHLTGRRKEIIIRGGENINPAELEECIASDLRVKAVKCVGVPDSHFGEEICACVELIPGATMTKDNVCELIKQKLAYYKIPKFVLFVGEFERTASGKVSLPKLKEYAKNRVAQALPEGGLSI